MKFGVPWSVKGIRPEARETAREAARRSGMSLGDWLNSVILHQAAEAGVVGSDDEQDDDDAYGNDLSTVHQRLDDISRRIDKVARGGGPAAYAPRRARAAEPDQIVQLIQRLDRRLDEFATVTRPPAPIAPPVSPAVHLPPALDLAVAEISARQRALNGGQPLPRQPAAAPAMPPAAQPAMQPMPAIVTAPRAPLPTQDLSGLEQQLRTITSQIETLHKPGVEDAINALREELGEIAHTLTEAMPQRAIDAIERQITGLNQRIAEGRQAGIDGNALAGIEHGLAEVRDALQHLTPAENLVGFNEAVNGLAHKIDMIVAQQDPATMQQLEYAVSTLRDISTHVASNEMVEHLAAEVQRLAQNVEHIALASGGGDALAHLEQRINALSDALADRAQNGGQVPPQLETLVNSLTDKIEQVQLSRGDNVAVGHLEDRIATLVAKLDASDSRLGHLEAIERGLADLLVHIEDIKAGRTVGGGETAPVVGALRDEIERTQSALDAVHGTLGQVVDRLAVIEQGIHGEPRTRPAPHETEPLELTQPVGKLAVRLVDAAPPIAPEPAVFAAPPPPPAPPAPPPQPPVMAEPPPPPPKRMPAARQLPIDPNLPPDQPLEPGSGPPPMHANPAARIAASEAALGGARPAAATVPSNKSNFIAAARRAAQAAVQQPAPRTPRSAADFMDADEPAAAPKAKGGSLLGRVKKMFVAASVIAVVIGAVQIASNFVDFGGPADKVAQNNDAADKTGTKAPADEADAPTTVAATTAQNSGQESAQEPAQQPPTAAASAPTAPVTGGNPAGLPAVALVQPGSSGTMPPLWTAPGANFSGTVTGSISHPAASAPSAPQAPLALPPSTDRLPPAIGSVRLRSAATAGDAAAAFEVGVRFAEGHGVPADINEAARWFERAAAKGLVPAQFRFGSLLEKGQGVKKDLTQARRLYLAAANAGNGKAMHNLAVLYAEGVDGKPDYQAAAQWFHKAALRGIPDSQFNLGVLYARGLGVTSNMSESYKWFALAAAKGDKEAVKKRDEVASRLDAHALTAAQLAVRSFVAEPQPDAAVNVPVPPGGWDTATPAPTGKPRVSAPLVLGKR